MAVGAIPASAPQVMPKGGVNESLKLLDANQPHWIWDAGKSLAQPAYSVWKNKDTLKSLASGVKPAANFWKELGKTTFKNNLVSSLWYDGLGSAIRNTIAVIQGKEKVARAAGNVTADVSVGTAKGIVSGLAVTGTTMGLTALGLTTFPFLLGVVPMLIGTMAVSMASYRLMNWADSKWQLHKKVSDFVTHLIDKKA